MSEPKPIYLNDTEADYWKKVARQERQKSEDNLRLAAERAIEIAELRQELKAARAEIARLKGEPTSPDYRYGETLKELSNLVGKYFGDIDDVNAYIMELRGEEEAK